MTDLATNVAAWNAAFAHRQAQPIDASDHDSALRCFALLLQNREHPLYMQHLAIQFVNDRAAGYADQHWQEFAHAGANSTVGTH